MSRMLRAIIGLTASFITIPSFAHDQAEAEKAVAAVVATYIEKYNNKDAAGVAALYAEDGILVPPGADSGRQGEHRKSVAGSV